MKLIKQITTQGNSLSVVIDKPIAERLKLKKGDYIEIDIKRVKENNGLE